MRSADYDPLDPSNKGGTDAIFRELRAQCPVHRHSFGQDDAPPVENVFTFGRPNEFWSLLKYDDIANVLDKPEVFSSADGNALERFKVSEGSATLAQADGDEHAKSRRLTQIAVSPKVIRRVAPLLQDRVDDLIDQLSDKGSMDVMADFALPVTAGMLQYLLDFPDEMRPEVTKWAQGFLGLSSGRADEVARAITVITEIAEYVAKVAPERLARAESGKQSSDALTTLLTTNDPKYGTLSLSEVISIMTQLIAAGFETSATAITNGVFLLLSHSEQLEKLKENPKLLPSAVEEVLRYMAPAEGVFRTTREDVVINGAEIPAGSKVRVVIASANRDADAFDSADEFMVDRDRGDLAKHLAFGGGAHTCLGNTLARQEMRTAFETLFRRIPTLRLDADGPPSWNPQFIVNGYDHLTVRWDIESVQPRQPRPTDS